MGMSKLRIGLWRAGDRRKAWKVSHSETKPLNGGSAAMEIQPMRKKTEVHGAAQRGGSVVSHVRFSGRVYSPLTPAGEVDILLAMEKLEGLRWAHYVRGGGTIILNSEQRMPAGAGPAVVDPVRTLVGRLDLEKYKATIKGLTQFGDRRQGTDRNRAAVDWIEAQLKSYGCPTERSKYVYNPPPQQTPPLTAQQQDFAMKATLQTHLTYVITGDPAIFPRVLCFQSILPSALLKQYTFLSSEPTITLLPETAGDPMNGPAPGVFHTIFLLTKSAQ